MFRHVCTVLPIFIHVYRIPDVLRGIYTAAVLEPPARCWAGDAPVAVDSRAPSLVWVREAAVCRRDRWGQWSEAHDSERCPQAEAGGGELESKDVLPP